MQPSFSHTFCSVQPVSEMMVMVTKVGTNLRRNLSKALHNIKENTSAVERLDNTF